jgi:hypothetical protein
LTPIIFFRLILNYFISPRFMGGLIAEFYAGWHRKNADMQSIGVRRCVHARVRDVLIAACTDEYQTDEQCGVPG